MKAIAVVGLARSGKDTVADYLKEKYGIKKFDFFTDVLSKELKERGMEVNKENAAKLGDLLRKETGHMDVLARKLMEEIENSSIELFIISGARSLEELEYIKSKVDEMKIIYVKADSELRFKREKKEMSREEFFQRDETDIKNKGTGKIIEAADFRIENNGSLKELHEKADEIIKNIGFF